MSSYLLVYIITRSNFVHYQDEYETVWSEPGLANIG